MNPSTFRKWFMLLALVVLPFTALSQTITITGVVVDTSDEPIPGAAIKVVGSERNTLSDIDGNFSLPNVRSNASIEVSYVGMQTVTLPVSQQMRIVLHDNSEQLEEVVVVAFGKQKREAFTGSAAVIKSDEITLRQANNPIAALEGKVPGMTMLASNNPASDNTINIRGLGSINASTSPLIILDGQPYNGALRDINPADVDNISVLKDAASNALYGARGANGVIMITTKNPQKGNTKVTVDMKWGANTDALIDYNVIDNPAEYYEAHYLALRNYNQRSLGMSASQAHLAANQVMASGDIEQGGLGYILYSVPAGQTLIGSNGRLNPAATLGNRVYNNGRVYTLYPDNWRDNGLRTGFRQEYNVNLSGGGDRYSSYFSIGYLEDEGVSYGSDLTRYSARLKTDYSPTDWAKVGASASYSHSEYNNMNTAFETVHSLAPIYPLFLRDQYGNVMHDARGPMYDYGDGTVGFVRQQEKNSNSLQSDRLDVAKTSANSFAMNGYVNIDFLKDFRLTFNGGLHLYEYRRNYAYNPYYGYYASIGGQVSTSTYRRTTTNFQQLLNWNHKFGDHSLEVLIGHEYNKYVTDQLSGSKSQIAIFEENIELNGSVINGSISGNSAMYNVEGFFGRVQYDYDSRYFASASFRRDGSSRFHPDHRWGNFWSVGGAWILTKEDWFPKTPAVNMLKFKISYGQQGNDGLGSSYYWTDYYTIENSNDQVAWSFNWKGNPNITWETTTNLNTGFEFNLFNSRLNGSVEYYNRKTSDMLYFKKVPSSLGYTGYYDNIGDMVNNGIELSLNGVIVNSRNVTWSVDLNLAWEKNKVTYLPESSRGLSLDGHEGYQGDYYFYGEGLPLYTWYIPKYMGPNDKGQPTWAVRNSDGTLGTTNTYDGASYFNCGTALPDLYGGFGTSLQAFGFDFTANFTYTVGGKKLDSGYESLMGSPWGSSIGVNIHRDALDCWSEDNPTAYLPRWQYNDTQNSQVSDQFLIDGSQLTFKTAQIGYTLPKKISGKFAAKTFRVYFSVDNVYYWTKRKGFDPRGSRTTYDASGYSPMRTFVGGINVVF